MSVQQVSYKLLSLTPQELKLLVTMIEMEKEKCIVSLRAVGRRTKRLEQHFHLVLDLEEKVEEA